MKSRRKSRELALQVLFQDEFQLGIGYQESLANFAEAFSEQRQNFEYAELLLNGVKSKQQEIDQKIQSFSRQWSLERMSLLDKNILRIACFELMYLRDDVAPAVVIDEAIEMAKTYSSTDSSGFINGILDPLAKSLS